MQCTLFCVGWLILLIYGKRPHEHWTIKSELGYKDW